ncbi:RNA polymerase III RPC4-domain-containing protein [Lipomyces kononenkoae]|uniref:RNA polymerase III RPC4-domain-containing protein n=1 Tax=Lipomyces kononenkoae TaxID=34357 RepID=A0ACC3SQ41_LIPKO
MAPKRGPQSEPSSASSSSSVPGTPIQPSLTFPAPPARLGSLSRPRAPASGLAQTVSVGLSRAGTGLASGPGSSLGAAGGLKFKPKLVARRPKEERDASAPAPSSAPAVSSSTPQSTRGRGRGRGRGSGPRGGGGPGRGGRIEIASTAAGPFADPSFGDPRGLRGPSFEKRPPQSEKDVAGQLKFTMSGMSINGKGTGESDSDDEAIREGVERIDIAKVAKVGGANGIDMGHYFPIRDSAARDHVEDGVALAEDIIDERAVSAREAEEFVGVFGDDGVDDHDLERKLFFFQFAPVLPSFESSRASVKLEQGVKQEPGVKSEPVAEEESPLTSLKRRAKVPSDSGSALSSVPGQDGLVGQLYIRKSGRVSIEWGGVEMEVAKGADTEFLQDVVVLDHADEHKATLLGQIARKVVVTPNIDILFKESDESE